MIALLVAVLGGWPFVGDLPDDRVVARATGPQGPIEITAGRLRRYAEAHPDQSPRVLATELIEFELLAAEAARRGLAADPEVQAAARPALVLRYLKGHFEAAWMPENLPMDLVAGSYERNKGFFVHPELVTADHLILTRDGKKPADPDLQARAAALMADVRQSLVADPPASPEAFVARAEGFQAQAKAMNLELRGERLGRFAQESAFDRGFTAEVFKLRERGDLSPVFTTGFGWHIARLEKYEPAANRSLQAVAPELRARITPEVRELKLRELTETLSRTHGVRLDFEPLQETVAE